MSNLFGKGSRNLPVFENLEEGQLYSFMRQFLGVQYATVARLIEEDERAMAIVKRAYASLSHYPTERERLGFVKDLGLRLTEVGREKGEEDTARRFYMV